LQSLKWAADEAKSRGGNSKVMEITISRVKGTHKREPQKGENAVPSGRHLRSFQEKKGEGQSRKNGELISVREETECKNRVLILGHLGTAGRKKDWK